MPTPEQLHLMEEVWKRTPLCVDAWLQPTYDQTIERYCPIAALCKFVADEGAVKFDAEDFTSVAADDNGFAQVWEKYGFALHARFGLTLQLMEEIVNAVDHITDDWDDHDHEPDDHVIMATALKQINQGE